MKNSKMGTLSLFSSLFSSLAASALITGCVTTQTLPTSMNRFIGQPSSALIAEFGQPIQQLEQAGRTIWVFQPVQLNIPLTIPTVNNQGAPAVVTSSTGETYPAACKVFFNIVNHKVNNWYSQGKDCPNH